MRSEPPVPDTAAGAPAAAVRPRRRPGVTLLRVLLGVAWSLLFAEAFFRVFHPMPLLPRHVGRTSFGIRGNLPNSRYWQRTQEVNVQIRINSRGIRSDEEIPYAKPPGVRRIVALGDSYMMGFEVDLHDTFLAQMERELAAAGVRCQVVNLSVSGFGNAEELLMLRHEGFRYDPDLVLLEWHDSDPRDNVRSDLFALENGRLVQRHDTYLPAVRISEALNRIPAYRWIDDNSHLWTFVRERATAAVKKALAGWRGAAAEQDADEAVAAAPAPARGPGAAPDTTTAPAEIGYPERLSLALLRETKEESAAHGAKFLVLDIPRRMTRTEIVSHFPKGDTTGLDIVEPLPLFRQHRGELLYWETGHGHFSPLGCRLAGHLLARRILDEGLLQR